MVVQACKTVRLHIFQLLNLSFGLKIEMTNMIDFDTWFRNILAISDLIASEDALLKAWVGRDQTITSAYDYDELATQALDDLELEQKTESFSRELGKLNALAETNTFVQAFLNVDKAVRDNPMLINPRNLLNSTRWVSLRNAAHELSAVPDVSLYRGV